VAGSTTQSVRIVIVGNGMFGAAATRHLAELGYPVLCIGAPPQRQDVRSATEINPPAHRVYSSHNDAARLTRHQDRNPEWAAVTRQAISQYRKIESASGISFFEDVGCLIAARPGGEGPGTDPLPGMIEAGIAHTYYEPGDTSWQRRWPDLAFPDSHYVAYEPSPAGYIRPKALIAAQNKLAGLAGATFVADTVVDIVDRGGRNHLATAGGHTFQADHVLVAAGAFSNFNGLLPRAADVSLKSEVIVLGEVTPFSAERLRRVPTVKYLLDPGDLEGIYMIPPVTYEDGRSYIKMGANTRLDKTVAGLDQLQRWFNADTDPEYLPILEPALRALWPGIDFVSVRTQPCVITYSPHERPIIEEVRTGLSVATAGNGGGAKGSDAWGLAAANLVAKALSIKPHD